MKSNKQYKFKKISKNGNSKWVKYTFKISQKLKIVRSDFISKYKRNLLKKYSAEKGIKKWKVKKKTTWMKENHDN